MSSFLHIMDASAKQMVFNRFKSYLGITDVNRDCVLFPKSLAQRKIAEKRGEGTVEFISIWRTGIQYDWARQNTAIARKGIMLQYNNSSSRTAIVTAKAVPAIIDYDVWFWSRDLDKITQAIESYLLWQHDHPQLILNYNGIYPMEMYLKFGPVVDETDFPSVYEKGLYFVSRVPMKLDGWILTLFDAKTILKIILDVYLREGTAPHYVDTLLSEYIITAGV